ncbi:MAG: hypothetical protein WB985_18380 [Candidatus Acidiferrales bacterium]
MPRRSLSCLAAFGVTLILSLALVSQATSQSTSSTTWTVTIVLPPKLVAGQPATLAILGVDGRLADGIAVDLGEDIRLKTDPSGRATFTVPTGVRFVIANAMGASAAALVDDTIPASTSEGMKVPSTIAQRDQFVIWGTQFHGDAHENHITFGGDPAFVLAASPECLVVAAGTRAIPGPTKILIQSPPAEWAASSTVVGLNFDPPLPPLEPDKRSQLVLHAQGSDQPLRVLVMNKTPRILHFVHGDEQQVVTSGGAQNLAPIEVQALATGDFSFNARLLPEPDAETARRFLEAAEALAPRDEKSEVKDLAQRLKHHPNDTFRVWVELRKIDTLSIAGDFRTLVEAARSALD